MIITVPKFLFHGVLYRKPKELRESGNFVIVFSLKLAPTISAVYLYVLNDIFGRVKT